MNSLLASAGRSPVFTATDAPYLLLDGDLTIRSANEAFLRATGRTLDELTGEYAFDAFPDNPQDPAADGVQNVSESMESVLRTAQRSYMRVQRYDMPGPTPDDAFVVKYWSIVNSPIRDDKGRAAGILNHADDVTAAVAPPSGHGGTAPAAGTGDREALTASRAGAVALARDEEAYAQLATKVDQLQQALDSRVVIEQAKGILMAEQRCGPAEAFKILRRASRDSHVKLQDLTAEMVAQAQQQPGPGG
jgi:ANTAR domain/PAS fold